MFAITVPSSTDESKSYTVRRVADNAWSCTCSDHVNRSRGQAFACRHIAEVAASLTTFVRDARTSAKAREIIAAAL